MARTRELPLANYPTGVRSFVRQVPNGLAGFRIEIARCTSATPTIWPNEASEIVLRVVPSYDGGATFDRKGLGGYRVGGGIKVRRDGTEAASFKFGAEFNLQPNAVEITVQVINGPIRTSVDVTIL